MTNIPQITLIAIDCKTPELAVEALRLSSSNIKFGKIAMLSDKKPFNLFDGVKFFEIEPINNLLEYSKFIINKLDSYVTTEFCIIVHADGYICNPHNWNPKFLNYDYIGGPWPSDEWFVKGKPECYRVGNGGFSLRSKKLLTLTKDLNCQEHEDVMITQTYRTRLEQQGVKFAPLSIASYFSQERICRDLQVNAETECFGFHGLEYSKFHKKNIQNVNLSFYKNSLPCMSPERLLNFLKNEIGVSETYYFGANFKGNLEVQQIPEEYLQLLTFFKNSDIKTYLELGVANGGSFFVNSIFLQNTAKIVHCVDCLAYKDAPHVLQTDKKILSKVNKLKEFFPEKEFCFFNQTTNNFFKENTSKYDCIFIDADHTYEGVMKDYWNSLKFVNNKGYLIFHDINNINTGVAQCWNEVSINHKVIDTFSHKSNKNCGIGIIQITC
jgi:hypothetical protein